MAAPPRNHEQYDLPDHELNTHSTYKTEDTIHSLAGERKSHSRMRTSGDLQVELLYELTCFIKFPVHPETILCHSSKRAQLVLSDEKPLHSLILHARVICKATSCYEYPKCTQFDLKNPR